MPTLPGGRGAVPTQLPGTPATTTTTTTTTTTVCLSNVPSDVDDTVLCQLIRPYGTVQSAHVPRDGCAVVTMSSVEEALRVLAAFNGRLLGDCVIQASLYTSPSGAPVSRPTAGSMVTLQPMLGLVTTPTGACQTLLLRNTATAAAAVNGDIFLRQCLPHTQHTYPHAPPTYELVQLPIM